MENTSVKKNYIYNLLYQLLIIILPLVTTPYLARTIGSNGSGIYGYTLSIVTYFVLFGTLGISMYGQREIAYIREDKYKRSKTFHEIIAFRLITMSISIISFVLLFTICNEYSLYYRILILELIANIMDITWFFQGMEDFKKTVIRNFIIKIIGLISIFTFVKNPSDTWIYVLIYCLSNLLGNTSLWFYIPKYIVKVPFKDLNIKKNIKPIFSLFIPQIAMQVYLVLDKTMIGLITNDMSEVGNYEQSQKIIKTALILVTALGTVVVPRIANSIAKNDIKEVQERIDKSYSYMWFLAIPLTLGFIACSSLIVPWFLGKGFEPSILLMQIGSLLILAIGLNNITGIQYLIPAKKQNLYTKSVCIAAVINFILNLILINICKASGAIIASVIAEFSIVIIQYFDVRKYIKINMFNKEILKCIISGIIMFIVLIILKPYFDSKMIPTLLLVIIGGTIYIFCLFISKYKIFEDLKELLKNKLKRRN